MVKKKKRRSSRREETKHLTSVSSESSLDKVTINKVTEDLRISLPESSSGSYDDDDSSFKSSSSGSGRAKDGVSQRRVSIRIDEVEHS